MEFLPYLSFNLATLEILMFQIFIAYLLYYAAKKYTNTFTDQPSSNTNEEPSIGIHDVDYIESVDLFFQKQIHWVFSVLLSIFIDCFRAGIRILRKDEPPSELSNSSPDGTTQKNIDPVHEEVVAVRQTPKCSNLGGCGDGASKYLGLNAKDGWLARMILRKDESPSELSNSSPEGTTQKNIEPVHEEVVAVRQTPKRSNLGGWGDVASRYFGLNDEDGCLARQLRSVKIYGQVLLSSFRSNRNEDSVLENNQG